MSIMQCDAVLLNGNVIVNESMLTGKLNTLFVLLLDYIIYLPLYLPLLYKENLIFDSSFF